MPVKIWPSCKSLINSILLIITLFNISCGVKGDPLPPEKPPLLGRGKPTYKEATEEFSLPKPPDIIFDEEDDDETINVDEEE